MDKLKTQSTLSRVLTFQLDSIRLKTELIRQLSNKLVVRNLTSDQYKINSTLLIQLKFNSILSYLYSTKLRALLHKKDDSKSNICTSNLPQVVFSLSLDYPMI